MTKIKFHIKNLNLVLEMRLKDIPSVGDRIFFEGNREGILEGLTDSFSVTSIEKVYSGSMSPNLDKVHVVAKYNGPYWHSYSKKVRGA